MPNEIKTDFDPRIMDESKFLNSPNKLPNIWVTLIKTNQQRLGDLSSNVWSHEFCGKTVIRRGIPQIVWYRIVKL